MLLFCNLFAYLIAPRIPPGRENEQGHCLVVTIVDVAVAIAVDVVGDIEFIKSGPNEVKLQVLLPNGLGLKVLSHFRSSWLQLGGRDSSQNLPNPTQMASKSSSRSY